MTIKYRDLLLGYINILNKPLKSEEELIEILKRRLTKKELKVLNGKETNLSDEQIATSINAEVDRVNIIYNGMVKKLNQEKVKQELMA